MDGFSEEVEKVKTWLQRQGYSKYSIKGYINDLKYFLTTSTFIKKRMGINKNLWLLLTILYPLFKSDEYNKPITNTIKREIKTTILVYVLIFFLNACQLKVKMDNPKKVKIAPYVYKQPQYYNRFICVEEVFVIWKYTYMNLKE